MDELNDYVWEAIYILKELYDHGKGQELIETYQDEKLSEDDFYQMAMEAIGYVFADSRFYYNEDKEIDVNVFFDPVITEFFQLCKQYEEAKGIAEEGNRFRQELYKSLQSDLCFNDYSYDYHIYDDPAKKGGCRIVLLLYPEFGTHYEAVGGLLDAYDTFAYQAKRLKEEMGLTGKGEILTLPAAESTEKVAA